MSLDAQIDALQAFYGVLATPPSDPFTLFVWEVLSFHAAPRKRDAALAALKRIPALTPDSLSRAPKKKLEDSVALAGPYLEQRLRALQTGADIFRRAPGLPDTIRGPLAHARRALQELPQMGDGGAHRMLLFAADHAVMPVDLRVGRVARRLGYGRPLRRTLSCELPPDPALFRRAFVYLEHHGTATCTEGDPHCAVCPLLEDCPDGRKRIQAAG